MHKISQVDNGNSEQDRANCLRRGKSWLNKPRLVLVLHQIGWERTATFRWPITSLCEAIKVHSRFTFETQVKISLNLGQTLYLILRSRRPHHPDFIRWDEKHVSLQLAEIVFSLLYWYEDWLKTIFFLPKNFLNPLGYKG